MFNKPKIYTVHIKVNEANAEEKPVFVYEGFNWKALVFGVFWTLYHRLWIVSLVVAAITALIAMAAGKHIISESSELILQAAFGIYIGLSANDWYRSSLSRRGYIINDIVVESDEIRAQQRYFEHALAAA